MKERKQHKDKKEENQGDRYRHSKRKIKRERRNEERKEDKTDEIIFLSD